MRKALQLEIQGTTLQGTLHENGLASGSEGAGTAGQGRRIGILSTNAGYQPRSSQGDLAAHLGDYTAALGFPSFRFDMPGVGDSEGELDREVLAFHELIQEGKHVKYISELRKKLMEQYSLRGTVFIGHCGSASTAVYEADLHPSNEVLGLVLLEPTFIWYHEPGKGRPGNKKRPQPSLNDRLKLRREALRAKLVQVPGGEKLTLVYARVINSVRRLRPPRLPLHSNERLIGSYRNLLARKLPILILTAPPVVKRPDHFDYLEHVLGGREYDHFTVESIEGASHSLLEGEGEEAVFAAIHKWLRRYFPDACAGGVEKHRVSCRIAT